MSEACAPSGAPPRDEPSCWPPPTRRQRNRFAFSVSTGACVHAALARDWRVFGPDSFTFEVLETLERGPGQTDAAFRADLETLRDIWRDKLTAEGAALYH